MRDERSDTNDVSTDRRSAPSRGRADVPSGSRRAVLKGVVGASTALGIGLPGSAAARQESDAAETPTASVSLRDQPSDGNIVVVDTVRLPAGGYVGIHSESLFRGDVEVSMIGVSDYLEAGVHDAVAIDLFDLEGIEFEEGHLTADQLLLASPHRETTGNEVNEFAATGGEADGPYTSAGAPVVDIGYVTVDADSDVATVSFRNQRVDGRTVTVDTVTLSDGGFVALHDATTFQDDLAASVVGVSRALGYGIHTDVEVDLFADAPAEPSSGTARPLVAVPHRDTNGNEAFDFIESAGDLDGPYVSDGRPVAAFGFVVPT